ncbi:hypothetical protein PQX77_005630 [Marasmius sp. AFHP31]|nr:hypothetical protein PQX77_005630 [Marasmius sp. AFHP31]
MPKGKPSPFNDDQLRVFDSYDTPMEDILRQHNLLLGKAARGTSDPGPVRRWFDDTRAAILDHPEFKDKLDYTERTASQWSHTVKERLKNMRYNKIVKRHSKAVVAQVNSNTLNANILNPQSNAPSLSPKVENDLNIVRELGRIHTIKTGKEIFEQEMSDKIKSLAREKRLKDATQNPGAAYQTALTELWNAADQDHFESRVVREGAGDIFENQRTFKEFFYGALTAICESAYFGPCELVLYAGFRDQDNIARTIRIDASSDPQSDVQFLQQDDKLKDMVYDAWTSFVAERLPIHAVEENTAATQGVQIPCNTAGVPVFPDVDENDISFTKFKDLYGRWLRSLWDYTWPKDQNMPAVPTADLLAHPHVFYDTAKYSFPAPLGSPDLLKRNTMFDFLVYLKSISNIENDDPFIFRSKEAIALGLTATQTRVEDERHAGDEVTVKPSDDNWESTNTRDGKDGSANPDSNDPLEPMTVQQDAFDSVRETTKGDGAQSSGTVVVEDVLSQALGLHHADSVPSSLVPEPATSIAPIPSDGAPTPPSPLPNPPSERSPPHTHPAPQTTLASNCPPSLKRKRGRNVVVDSGSDEMVEKAVEEVVEEAAGSVAPKPKKRRGKKQVVQSGADETLADAAGNVVPETKKKKPNKFWGYGLAPSKGTLERSPEKVLGRTRGQARKHAQA